YKLLLTIARRPKCFIYGAGLLTAVVLILASIATTLWMDENKTYAQHYRAAQLAMATAAEADALLKHMASLHHPGCNTQDLIHLNAHLLQSRYLREIGILDNDRRLLCSTALGRLPQPVKGDYPVIRSSNGRELLINVPLQMADKALDATIIQHGNFNVVVSPYATQELYASADAVWLRTPDGLALLNSNAPTDALEALRKQAGAVSETALLFHGWGYTLVTVVPDAELVLLTQRNLAAA